MDVVPKRFRSRLTGVDDVDPGRDSGAHVGVNVGIDGNVDFKEDALPRAYLGRPDHIVDPPRRHCNKASRSAGIVLRYASGDDVRDPVFEQGKDIGRMVDTQPVAGAQILVDPNLHRAINLSGVA